MATPETATVWRGGKRRYFTKGAAERADARALIKRKCECCNGDEITPPYVCTYHADPRKYARMVRLLVAMFVRKAKP